MTDGTLSGHANANANAEIYNTRLEVVKLRLETEFKEKLAAHTKQLKKDFDAKLAEEKNNFTAKLSAAQDTISTLQQENEELKKDNDLKAKQIARQSKLLKINI